MASEQTGNTKYLKIKTDNLHREDLLFISFLWFSLIVAEHECIAPGGMPVEVTEKEDVSTFQRTFHHQLCVVIDRIEF